MPETVAVPPVEERKQSALRGFAGDVGPKLFVTAIAAGITALLIPWINGKWQDHKQQLELRTQLATDMSRAYTDVITSERFVAFGLVYAAGDKQAQVTANANAWQSAWHDWLVNAGTLDAQLTARYGAGGIAAEWKTYTAEVAAYIRLGAEIAPKDRAALVRDVRDYVGATGIDWRGLTAHTKHLKQYADFKQAYTLLGDRLLARGDALVQEELRLSPKV